MNNNNSINRYFRCCLLLLLKIIFLSEFAFADVTAVPDSTKAQNTANKIKTITKMVDESTSTQTASTQTTLTQATLIQTKSTQTTSIQGRVTFTGKKSAENEIKDTIIYFEPNRKALIQPLITPHQIMMRKKEYYPRVSVVTVGSEIQISNHDSIIHNAFSPSKPNDFDLGFYGKSEGKIYRISEPGVVRVFCNVHFHMVAYVLVLETPYFTQPDKNGFYSLDNLPPGDGQLVFWHERTEQIIKKISVPYSRNVDVELEVNKRRVPEHKNKSGGSYNNKKRSRRSYN